MEHDHERLARDTEGGPHGNGQGVEPEVEPEFGIAHSIRPGVTAPATVLVAAMTDGSYLLVGYPQSEPAAFIAVDDAHPMWQALKTAFGTPEDTPINDNNA
jgi:hypothetical protein